VTLVAPNRDRGTARQLVASGRVTPDEAARLRETAGTSEFDAAIAAVRARHAQAHTDLAVEEGRMSEDEAHGYLECVRGGEHSRALRAHIKGRD
jgi:hypothetical protein